VILKRRHESTETAYGETSTKHQRSRLSSVTHCDTNPGSVQSSTTSTGGDFEDFDANSMSMGQSEFDEHKPKRRGRPPKPIASCPINPSEYSNMSEADWKYRELRNKNNEASRRSRLNRKEKETHTEIEANEMTRRYRILEVQERKLIKECGKWRKAVMALALV
jgi:hypothetical protein